MAQKMPAEDVDGEIESDAGRYDGVMNFMK